MNIGYFVEYCSIAVMESYSLKNAVDDGDDLVFLYSFIDQQCDHIADDEYGENVIFEIAPTID